MFINSIYPTISGEVGIVIPQGYPCLVIRTQGCNLKCWYCDAKETQDTKGGGIWYSIENLLETIKIHNLPVLLTGGEPFLQEDCGTFIRTCEDHDIVIQIETNGTIKLPEEITDDVGIIADYKFGKVFALDFFYDFSTNDYVKFVVEDMQDLRDAHSIINKHKHESAVNWAISPVQGTKDSLSSKEIGEYIILYSIPAVLNVQLHKTIDMP